MRTLSKSCAEHDDFLEQLALAQGERRPLPSAPEGCEVCAANRERFTLVQRLLQQHTTPPLLSPDWQAGVWLRLGAEHQPEITTEPGVESDLDSAKIVRFPGPPAPRAEPSSPSTPTSTPASPATPTPRRGWPIWQVAVAASVALLLTGVGLGIGWLKGFDAGSEVDPNAPPRTLWRGNHAVQPSNPPRVAAQLPPQVRLAAYAVADDQGDEERFDSLHDGATIPSGARLSFDYATEANGDELQYLTVVAVVRSQEAQARSLPEGKQLLWLVESKPVQDTRGHLNVLDDEDIRVDAPPGEMTIYGLVSRQPMPSRAVEDALLLQSAGPGALPGVGVARLDLKVAAR